MSDEEVINAVALSKSFGQKQAVNNINLALTKGKIIGFLGPNGCGKSTTIRMLTGLLTPTSGSIQVLGDSLPQQAELLKQKIGYMTQQFSLYGDLTVKENLEFIGRIYGLNGTPLQQRINQQLVTYQLDALAQQRVDSMSGGQKQRLSLAAATIHQPELLFLDEPTSAVDPENRRQFWEKLFELCDQGTTILVSTHYMDEAERCHYLAIMDAGHIRAFGKPQTLMTDLDANVIEAQSKHLQEIKPKLQAQKEIRSIAQVGAYLRILIDNQVDEPIAWLQQHFFTSDSDVLVVVRPSIEDVFVSVTQGQST
ncbi:MAG: ABC transporter ATP-binding protein [Parashewanella sp.]